MADDEAEDLQALSDEELDHRALERIGDSIVPRPVTLVEAFARRLKRLREGQRGRRGHMSQAELAGAMTELGVPTTRDVIASIEGGRRDRISLDELFAAAVALHVSPVALLIPDDDSGPEIRVVPERDGIEPRQLREWLASRSVSDYLHDEDPLRRAMEAEPRLAPIIEALVNTFGETNALVTMRDADGTSPVPGPTRIRVDAEGVTVDTEDRSDTDGA